VALADPDAAAEPGAFHVSYRLAEGREADEVAARGRLADLVIVAGASEGQDEGFAPGLEAALFETGGPVLMVPGAVSGDFGKAVAVAWDGTMEAARAARGALPLRAEAVFVLTADMDKAQAKPSQLASYLAQHGIEAKTWAFRPDGTSLGEALLAEAGEAGADMLVMGAYGHSRLRELVLGGVTRTVTAKAGIPVLMAH
jgi:nucleotide-binding universal stress UspA family protein